MRLVVLWLRRQSYIMFRAVFIALSFACAFPAPAPAAAQERFASPEKLPPLPDAVTSWNEGGQEEDDLLFPLKRNLWFEQQRSYPGAEIPKGSYWHAQMQKHAILARHMSGIGTVSPEIAAQADPFSGVTWTPDGPQPVAAYFGSTPYSGRATSIAVHPTDPNTVYLGTAGGGVWKTTDGGQNWVPLTDSQASLAIGAVAIDPNNPSTIYVGTGEPDFSGDSYYGQGILKSTDGGATWTLIRTPFTTGDSAPDFTQIAVQPGNSNVVLAGNVGVWNGSGLYRSTDAGQTWTQVVAPGGYAGVTAVMFDVKTPTTVYAGMGGYSPTATSSVWISKDSGKSWNPIGGSGTGAVPAPSAVVRTALAESSDGGTLFAAFANSNFSAPGTVYTTTNGGTSWTKLSSPSTSDGLDWYRNAIAVAPTNPQVLYASGVGLYESTNGGQSWTAVSGSPIYADQHAFAFSGDGSRMYLADDGGVFVTTTPTAANAGFTPLNATINTLTFYPGFSLLPGQANSALAGSQDHGLNLYTGSVAWPNGEQAGYCGDGGSVYVDPQGKYAYAHCQGGRANWAANSTGDASTGSWVAAQSGINTSDRWPWVADIKGDQQTISTVYTATNHLYQSTNNAASWTAISGDLTAGNSIITTIGISPGDSNTIYTGAGDGTVSVTRNALAGTTATWKTLAGLPNRSISKILVQPDSANDVYVTLSGFDTGHVFHSTNGGGSWTNISGDLPNTPVDSILVDPNLLNTIYVATDTGVFVTSNGGTNWTPLGQGLPNVVVQDILMYQPTRTLRVITHGRGAWDASVPLAALQSSADSFTFANQTRGTTSAPQIVTLTNNMVSGSLNVTGFQLTGPFTQTNNCSTALASAGTCTVNIAFAPTTAGNFNGTLIVSSSSNTVVISLSGTGLGIPNAVLGASSITFSNQPLGIASAAQTVQLSNSGDASLANIVISIGGANASAFSQTNECGTTLAAGANCTITTGFTPGAVGTESATLSISDNAPGSPQSVSLGGLGEAPFTISASSTSSTVTAGSSASYQLTIAAAQGSQVASAVALSCNGLPSLSGCSFSPSSVPAGSSTQNVTLTISTTPASSSARAQIRAASMGLTVLSWLTLMLLPRRRSWVRLLTLVILVVSLPGCSGGNNDGNSGNSGKNPGTPAGTYEVTVTAAQSSIYQTTQALTFTVQQ